MSAKAAQILIFKREKESSFYSYSNGADRSQPREPILLWDKIANRWPRERFPSFIYSEVAVGGEPW
jgi:hypothetical protein